jgi:transposase
LIIHRTVHSAGIQDRHGAPDLLEPVARKCPHLVCIVADAAYRGEDTKRAITARGPWRLEIVRRADNAPFKVLPKRWIVERTFAWLGRCRRLAKDFECLVHMAVAFIDLAMIRLILRRLARPAT